MKYFADDMYNSTDDKEFGMDQFRSSAAFHFAVLLYNMSDLPLAAK